MAIADTRLRAGTRQQRAVGHYSRERRRSLGSDQRLFANALLAPDESIQMFAGAPDGAAPVTFESRGTFEAAGTPGQTVLTTQAYDILTSATGLTITGPALSEAVSLNAGQVFRWTLAIRPSDGAVRFWVGSEVRVRATATPGLVWHTNATLHYGITDLLSTNESLQASYSQLPRHFL